jgi:hypothetical protein
VLAQAVQCLTKGWTIGVRSPTGAKDFSSSPCVQTGSGAHPASYPMGTEGLSPGVKRGWGVTLTTHPHLVPRLIMSRNYTSSPPCASMAYSRTALLFLLYFTNPVRPDHFNIAEVASSFVHQIRYCLFDVKRQPYHKITQS